MIVADAVLYQPSAESTSSAYIARKTSTELPAVLLPSGAISVLDIRFEPGPRIRQFLTMNKKCMCWDAVNEPIFGETKLTHI